jgi:hypothetical protein
VSLLLLVAALVLATDPVDGLVVGGGGQPGAGVGGHAVGRPPLDGDRERLGRRLLCDVEVTETPGQGGDHPGRLRERGIAATIPERNDQIAHRRKKPGRPIDFGDEQRVRYKGRNVVERCFNRLKQWRGIAMRRDKLARNYRASICLAATLIWIKTDLG